MSQNLSSAAVVIGALRVKLPFVFKTFVLSIFEWPLNTGFTVCIKQTLPFTVWSSSLILNLLESPSVCIHVRRFYFTAH